MKNLLIMDFNNLLLRYSEIHSDMKFHDKNTGGVFGFLTQLCYQINLYKPDIIIVGSDKKPYKRTEIFPDYKKKDKPYDEELGAFIRESTPYCKQLLDKLHIPLWEVEGYEYDDLAAILVHRNRYKMESITLVSNDEDLFALLNTNVSIHRSKGLYALDDFKKEYGIHPSEWSEVEAMCGTHNNIPNLYKGLGKKTALKIYKNREKMKEIVEKYSEQYLLNLSLILLPIDFNVNLKLENRTPFMITPVENFLIHNFGISITKSMSDAFYLLNEVALFCPKSNIGESMC